MQIFGVEYTQNTVTGKFIVQALDGTKREYENPIEAWTHFIGKVDSIGRRKIGDNLKNQGRNSYTGKLEIKPKEGLSK